MYCGNCGASNDDGARFCAECGGPLQAAPPPPAAQQPIVPPTPSISGAPPAYQPPQAYAGPARSGGGGNGLLLAIVAVLGIAVLAVGVLIFAGDAVRAALPGGSGGQVTGVPTGVVVAVATSAPASLSGSPAAQTSSPTTAASPTAQAATPTVAATRAPSPSPVPPTPARVPPTATAVPKPPAPTAVPKRPVPVLGPAVANEALGVRAQPIQGWQKQEDVDRMRQGSLMFFAPGDPNRSYAFNKPGVFVINMWPLSSQKLIPSEDMLMGFEDGLIPEYVTKFGGGVDVTHEPLRRLFNAMFVGSTTTVTVTGPKGDYKYRWDDISKDGVAIYVFCGGAAENFRSLEESCTMMYSSMRFWFGP